MNNVITVIRILAAVSAAFYYAGAVCGFALKSKKGAASILAGLGFAANLSVVVINFLQNGYVPFVSMYQVMTFIGACFPLTYLYMRYVCGFEWMKGYFFLCSALFMTGMQFMELTPREFPPALQSPFFIPHVAAYMLSYALLTVSFVITLVWLFTKDEQKKKQTLYGIYRLIAIAFPFMTLAMMLGAVWADQVWGDFWAFDVKENWSLITWLLYALFLHAYRSPKLQKYCKWLSILGFAALFITFIGISLFQDIMGALGVHITYNSQHVYSS